VRVAIIGGGVIGLACAWSLAQKDVEVVVLERGVIGEGASKGNTGWVSPTISTPLASPGTLAMGLKSALDRNGALVIRPELDTRWMKWLWAFRAAASRERFLLGDEALHNLNRRTFEVLDACHERIQRMLRRLQWLRVHLATMGCDDQARQAARDVLRYFDLAAPAHHDGGD
jgi:D-amino-acid dehydrogenase